MNRDPLYDMTAMSGRRASESRSVAVGPIDTSHRLILLLPLAFLVSLAPAGLVWALAGGTAALLTEIFCIACLVWLFHGRGRDDLQLRNWRRLLNRRQAVLNQFMVGSQVVQIPSTEYRMIVPGSRPNPDLADVVDQDGRTRISDPAAVVDIVFGPRPGKGHTTKAGR